MFRCVHVPDIVVGEVLIKCAPTVPVSEARGLGLFSTTYCSLLRKIICNCTAVYPTPCYAKHLHGIFVLLGCVAFSVSPCFTPCFRAERSPRDAGPCRPERRHDALLYLLFITVLYVKSI